MLICDVGKVWGRALSQNIRDSVGWRKATIDVRSGKAITSYIRFLA